MSVPKELRNVQVGLLVSLVKVRCLEQVQKAMNASSMMKFVDGRTSLIFLNCNSDLSVGVYFRFRDLITATLQENV